MAESRSSVPPHQHHLEQARAQVMELLSRQAVERDLVARSKRQPEVVSQLVERQHRVALEQRLAAMHPADVAFVMEGLNPEARDLAWDLVRPERRGAVLLETSDAVRLAVIRELGPEAIAGLVGPLDAADIAELVAELPQHTQMAVLDLLDKVEQREVRSVLSFPRGSVGGAMELEVVTAREDDTLDAVHQMLQRRTELPAHTNELFVVDRSSRPVGTLSLSRLLIGDRSAIVRDQMSRELTVFRTDDPMREAVNAFEKYDLVSAPVVNLHDQVVGRLTVDAVVDELNERAHAEGLRKVGLSEQDKDVFAPVRIAARGRWPWLAINLCTALLASRVIGAFEHLISGLSALAALMPIVASIGGNAGNQSVALMLQSLADKRLTPQDVRRFVVRECAIALINGALWGTLLGAIALMLYGNLMLSCVLALSLLLNLFVAALVGVLSPALLARAGRDPAMGSSILLTATTDSLGFLIFLGLSALLLT